MIDQSLYKYIHIFLVKYGDYPKHLPITKEEYHALAYEHYFSMPMDIKGVPKFNGIPLFLHPQGTLMRQQVTNNHKDVEYMLNNDVILNKKYVHLTQQINEMQFKITSDYLREVGYLMLVDLHGFVMAENQEPIIIKYPSTWLEYLKERLGWKWLTSRWPIKYTTRTISVDVVYPDLKISIPPNQSRAVVHIREKPISYV